MFANKRRSVRATTPPHKRASRCSGAAPTPANASSSRAKASKAGCTTTRAATCPIASAGSFDGDELEAGSNPRNRNSTPRCD